MYITNSMIIVKEAQHLENVKTPEDFTDRELTRALRDAIIAEEGAINQYETVVDATNNEEAKTVLQSIADEEKIHVGELQVLLNKLLPDEEKFLEDGKKEVEDLEGSDVPDSTDAAEESSYAETEEETEEEDEED